MEQKDRAMASLVGVALAALLVPGLLMSKQASALPEGVETVKVKPTSEDHPLDEILSGWHYRSPETQALQEDDFENPAFLWVEQGEELWSTADGAANKSCASCHEDASETMASTGANMPKWNEAPGQTGKPGAADQSLPDRADGSGSLEMGIDPACSP